MRFITIITQFFRTNPLNLGRWNISYNANIINRKIDMANIDNCGICYD